MKPAGRAWVVAVVLLLAYVAWGTQSDVTSSQLTWLPKVALCLSTLVPFAFVVLNTVLGLRGGAKWWRNDIGVNIVWLMIADVIDHGLIGWAVLFNHGILNSFWLAWAYVGCQFAAAIIVAWRGVIWMRGYGERERVRTKQVKITNKFEGGSEEPSAS